MAPGQGTPTPAYTTICEAAEDAKDYFEQHVAPLLLARDAPLNARIMAGKLQRLVTLAAEHQDGCLEGIHRIRYGKSRREFVRNRQMRRQDDDPTRAA